MTCKDMQFMLQFCEVHCLGGQFSFPTYLNELLAVIGCEVLVFDSLDGRELVPYQDKVCSDRQTFHQAVVYRQQWEGIAPFFNDATWPSNGH